MTTAEPTAASEPVEAANPIYTKLYRVFAYFGVMTVSGSLL